MVVCVLTSGPYLILGHSSHSMPCAKGWSTLSMPIARQPPDFIVEHRLEIKDAMANADKGAFLPIRERDLFQLGPLSMLLPEFDPAHQGLIFPDLSLEDPDRESIMEDEVSPEMKIMILTALRESQPNNQLMVQLLDAKARSLYSSVTGLVNDWVETLRGFSKVQKALDICLQSIVRKSGPFVKETCTSLAGVKLLKDKSLTCAMYLANNVAKKKRRKGSGRKAQGLPPRNPLPPVQGRTLWKLGPAAQGRSGLPKSKSGSGKHPKSSKKEKNGTNISSTPVCKDQKVKTTETDFQMAQAKSQSPSTHDQGGVGQSGSYQSSSYHGRTHQDQESSTKSCPPRPAPVAVTPTAQAS